MVQTTSQSHGQLSQQKLQEFEPPEPDWNRLEYEDPTEYARQWTSHQRRQQQKFAVQAEQMRLNQMREAEMQKQITEDSVTLMPNYPDEDALWLARSLFIEQSDSNILHPILEHLTVWADAAYAKFATWPNTPRFNLVDGGKLD